MNIRKTIGKNIATRRACLRMTQVQLANAIGCSRSLVQWVEWGKRSFPFENVPQLVKVLKIQDYNQLFEKDAFI